MQTWKETKKELFSSKKNLYPKKLKFYIVYHFGFQIKENVEELVFSLCILGGIQDSRGKLFVNRSNFFICIEMLDPAVQVRWKKNESETVYAEFSYDALVWKKNDWHCP